MILFFGYGVFQGRDNQYGAYLVSTVTNTTSSISMNSSTTIATGANLQYLEISNTGSGQIACAFGATAVLDAGLRLNPVGSSTLVTRIITDQNLLAKGVNCIATATTTVQVLKY